MDVKIAVGHGATYPTGPLGRNAGLLRGELGIAKTLFEQRVGFEPRLAFTAPTLILSGQSAPKRMGIGNPAGCSRFPGDSRPQAPGDGCLMRRIPTILTPYYCYYLIRKDKRDT